MHDRYLDSLVKRPFGISRSISVLGVLRRDVSSVVIEVGIDHAVTNCLGDDEFGILRSVEGEMIGNVC